MPPVIGAWVGTCGKRGLAPVVATVTAGVNAVYGLTSVTYLIAPAIAVVVQKTYTVPVESTAPAMSGGSVAPAAGSMTSREFQLTAPLTIGAASGVRSQYVTPVQVGPPWLVKARKT